MSTIEVAIAGRGIQVKQGYEKPSAGDVNTCQVSIAIESGGVWDSLPHKRVTFATRTASVTVDYAPTITIPHEVLASPGALYLTLTGYDADGIEVARTNRMTYPIEVARAGADEGAEPSPATLDVVSRIDSLASTLEASETTRQEAFDSAQNERSDAFQASMNEWQQYVAESVSHASNAATLANEAATNANNVTSNANKAAASANTAASEAHNAANELRDAAERGDFDGEPGAPGSDASATDVRINGTSITVDGVADVPLASLDKYGAVKSGLATDGVYVDSNGVIKLQIAGITQIDNRSSRYQPINPQFLDYAVKAAMCDGKGAAWTAAEQSAARERMNAADANKVYIMQKQIENLQGIAATEETDSTEAYTKTVPTGAQKWASLDKVGGKTVVWNQLSAMKDVPVSSTRDGVTRVKDSVLGTITLNGISKISAYDWIDHFVTTKGHRYLFFGCPAGGDDNSYKLNFGQISDTGDGNIFTETESGTTRYFTYHIATDYDYTNFVYRPRIVDITQMFGAGNEPTSIDDPRIDMIRSIAEARPEYNQGELMSAEVVEVESKGTFPIQQSVRDMCPGYGWSAGTACNEIDFGRKVYVQRVGSVDLSTLNLSKGNASNIDEGYFGYYLHVPGSFPQMKPSDNVVCGRFFYHTQTAMWENMPADSFFSNEYLFFQAKYDTIQDFKAAMHGVMLYYELATPIEVDLSNVLPDDHYIEVEAGGTVTFRQASTQLPVLSSVTYQIRTSEVIANA